MDTNERNQIKLAGILTPPPVFSCSIEPDSLRDESALEEALGYLQMEDPSFRLKMDKDTGQQIVSGMGELHLEIIQDRILKHYNVSATMGKVNIAYRSSIYSSARKSLSVQDEQKKNTFMDISVVPLERGSGNVTKIDVSFDTVVDNKKVFDELQSVLQEGLRTALEQGTLGYPATDIQVTIHSIVYDEPNINSFKRCCSRLIHELLAQCHPRLLEPIMSVEVSYIGIYSKKF